MPHGLRSIIALVAKIDQYHISMLLGPFLSILFYKLLSEHPVGHGTVGFVSLSLCQRTTSSSGRTRRVRFLCPDARHVLLTYLFALAMGSQQRGIKVVDLCSC